MIVKKVENEQEKKEIFKLRREVFVIEQKVTEDEEFDEFEDTSVHFIAKKATKTVGTARWRKTKKGVKLERFAVDKDSRGEGVGSNLVKKVVEDILAIGFQGKMYLHAQIDAVPLYEKFNFVKQGEPFQECNIWHYLMVRVS